MAMLGARFPDVQFVVTGVLGPDSNAHGPNEYLHLPTARNVTLAVAHLLEAHTTRQVEQSGSRRDDAEREAVEAAQEGLSGVAEGDDDELGTAGAVGVDGDVDGGGGLVGFEDDGAARRRVVRGGGLGKPEQGQ